MTLEKFNKHLEKMYDSVNHHQVDLYLLTLQQIVREYPKIADSIIKDDFKIGVHENFAWGETAFDITWSDNFAQRMSEEYPELLI